MLQKHDPYHALKYRNFRLLLLAHGLHIIASQMQSTAVGWDLYLRTGHVLLLGIVGLIQYLPVLLLSIPIGHFADTHSRRQMLMLGEILLLCSSIGLFYVSIVQAPVWLALVFLLLTGVSNAITSISRMSLWAHVVPSEAMQNAVSWSSSVRQIATISGPMIAGALIAALNISSAYAVCAVFSMCFVLCVALLRVPPRVRAEKGMSMESLLMGLRFTFSDPLILSTSLLDLFGVLFGGATALLPVFAKDILMVGSVGLGMLRAAPSVGAIAISFALAYRPLKRSAGSAILWSLVGFGLSTIIFGLSKNFTLSVLMLACTGAFDSISVVVRSTLLHIRTPDSMRGRVNGINSIFISSSNELGYFESGLVAQFMGSVFSVVSGGVGTLLVVGLVALAWPQLRRLDSLRPEVLR